MAFEGQKRLKKQSYTKLSYLGLSSLALVFLRVVSYFMIIELRLFQTLEYSKPKRSLVAQLELLRSRWLRSSSMIMILKNMFVLLHQCSALVFLRVVSYFVIIELGHVPMSKQAFFFGPACRQHVGSPFEAMITGFINNKPLLLARQTRQRQSKIF